MPPALGRQFDAQDDRSGAEPVVIISDDVWRRRYNGDAGIIGRRVMLNGRPHTVVGVMPPKFSFPETQQVWIPLIPVAEKEPPTNRSLFAFGRMKPGVDLARARSERVGNGGHDRRTVSRHQRRVDRHGQAHSG